MKTQWYRAGHRLALVALLALLPAAAAAGPWADWLVDPLYGRSPLDSIPPSPLPSAWVLSQPASYMPGSPTEQTTSVTLDPVAGTIRESSRQGDVEMGFPVISTFAAYDTVLSRRTEKRVWRLLTRQSRSLTRTSAARGGLFRVELPVQLPKPIRSIVGDGAPNLEVAGSENISLSGQSDWVVNRLNTEAPHQSAFPSLEMKQELNVNLTGSIGDKIKVDVDQSSNVSSSLDNKVKLRYEGDDDDMVQSVELGNTNLSLAGASFRQDGLFGVKTVMKLGTVDLTTIASKQEGKSETARFTPSGENRSVRVLDLDYVKHQYYFIADHPLTYDHGSLVVYRDDQNPANDLTTGAIPGVARLYTDVDSSSTTNPQYEGHFDRLQAGQDYDVITPYVTARAGIEIPVIKLHVPLAETDVLGVAYIEHGAGGTIDTVGSIAPGIVKPGKDATQILLKLIKAGPDAIGRDPSGRYITTDPLFPLLNFELRNFYDLNARNIDLTTLTLVVRRSDSNLAVDPDNINGIPLVQILGLDKVGKPGSANPNRPDGQIDDQYIDQTEGRIFFPDLHPFDPDTLAPASGSCSPGYSGFLCLEHTGASGDQVQNNILREGGAGNLANPNVYYYKTVNEATDARYYIDAQFKSSQQGYFLGRTDILENSEQVKVDGILQKRGSDYSIDYGTGQITFVKAPGPDQVITVDYSFAPGVGQVQRTLLGFSSSYNPSANFSLSSSMLYESRGAAEQNPKLGEEPARSMVGDLSTVTSFQPSFMTTLANLVPGVRTNQPSALNIQGGISVSKPNPNTQGEAYIDDMEGNLESTSFPLGRTQYMWSSVPIAQSDQPSDHGIVWWYNPHGVKEKDLTPVLTQEEGSDNEHQVLEINVKPNSYVGSSAFTLASWTGITQGLSRTGDDYSKMRYLEIWVNDRQQNHAATSAILHIDFGRVSEDAFWSPTEPPNGKLDTEDKNGDTKLDAGEDTGLDGLADKDEPGYDPRTNPDPNHDDYAYDPNHPNDYSHINGTEGNGANDPNARPDTEDLDLNGVLDTDNDYFETSIDLARGRLVGNDTLDIVAKDIPNDYPPSMWRPGNGWRLFRIPIEGDAFQAVGNPHWDSIKHLRFWLSGFSTSVDSLNIQIGGIDLAGNRWLRVPITSPDMVARGVTLDVLSRNNKDDAGAPVNYRPPFQVQRAVGGNATQREQSLALGYKRLAPGDSVFAFRTVSDNGTGIGYTQYREIRLWMHGDESGVSQNLRMVARFGADTISYYEYSRPVTPGWHAVIIPMEVLSRLKEQSDSLVRVDSVSYAATGEKYTVVGNPSFTRVNRIQFGLTVFGGAATADSGEVWVDELRLAGVRKDTGKSGNLTVQANFADVLALNATYQNQDANYFRVGSGVNQGTGFNHNALGLSTTFNLDKMLPRSGLQVPLRLTYQKATDVPKYRTGSDVVLDASRSGIETREQTRQSLDLSYHRTGLRKGITRYTIDALSGGISYSRQGSVAPQSVDSSWSFQSNLSYDLPIGGGKGIDLSHRMKIKFLPENISLSSAWTSTRTVGYARQILDTTDVRSLRSDVKTRLLNLTGRVSYVPVSSITTSLKISSDRDMLLHQPGPLGYNKGTEVAHSQQLDVAWIPRWLTTFAPNVSLTGLYQERGGPTLKIAPTDPDNIKTISNTGTARATAKIPLGRLGDHFARRPSAARDTSGTDYLAPLKLLLSKLEDIQTSFGMDRSSVVSRVAGNAGFAFRTGFTQKFSPELIDTIAGSNVANTRRYTTGANTSLHATQTLNVDVRADHSLSFTDANYGARRTYSLSWPDVTLRWAELQRPLGLTEQFQSLGLNCHYSVKADENGPTGQEPDRRIETSTWAPLLGWQASWRNGLRTDVNSAYTKVRDMDLTAFGVTHERKSTNHDIKFTKLYPASRGIKLPWSKKRIRLPNDLNLNLAVTVQTDQQSTIYRTGQSTLEQNQQTLNLSSGTTYNFSQSITGGFNMGFRQTKDRKSDITTRSVNVAFTAQFRF